jgi:gamma-glutamyltranspeptidase
MTVKNGGNTIDAVEALALCVSHCISRACGLAGGDSFSLLKQIPFTALI